jgi:pilus assembly protein Flp/PilA
MDQIIRFTFDEAGASAVEYALLLSFIALVIISSVMALGAKLVGIFSNAEALLPG